MMYLKLSIRNARRSFTDYLLYVVTVTILLAVTEASNCISIAGKLADFQTISLPLLITVIQIILIGHTNTFMLKQRAKELANYSLLGMKKNKLTALFLCEILLISLFCFAAGTTIGFSVYAMFCFRMPLQKLRHFGFLYGKSVFYTFCCFCITETVCALRMKARLQNLQIRELMYEQNRSQKVQNHNHYLKWGILSFVCFVCLTGLVYGIVHLPESAVIYAISVVSVPLLIAVFAFYHWFFGYLYAYRQKKPVGIYQHNRPYIMAVLTTNFHTAATVNAVFSMCFLFSAASFITGLFMLQPDLQLFEKTAQQWMGSLQISICIVFMVIYFSILSLQQIMALRQSARTNQILCYLGKSSRKVSILIKQQIAVKLTLPMIMPLFISLFCIPLLNRKLNLLLPVSLHNALLKYAGGFYLCTLLFFFCYFRILFAMGRQYIKSPD